MTSLFQRALGADFARLHPQLQRRFSVGLDSAEACVGRGVMDRVWHGRPFVRPFLTLGATRHILMPETGRDIPFTIANVPYRDAHGREAVTFARAFRFPRRTRRFDAYMVDSPRRGALVDYLGTHQHLATELRPEVDGDALVIRSGPLRFHEGVVDARVPRLLDAAATVREAYDAAAGRFRIEVSVVSPYAGPLFGYRGWFVASYRPADGGALPAALRPVREEARV
ncbi:DUF4166 domain-containing protein [Streptomyces sp. 4N509B]|uniref:DUF4166 domain-containing protein n=1 Tax=Streptomyces sp. 4N509B TaxID=3457413 RepID=UPI003FD66107